MNEQDTSTVKFFRELSRRMHKENDLSDMVYALCRSNTGFKQFFLDFIFGKDFIDAKRCRMDREVWFESDRPDFVVTEENGSTYFIEVKINDANHHFNQYVTRLSKENNCERGKANQRLGYIANYEIRENSLSELDKEVFRECKKLSLCHTWKELKETLAKSIANRTQYPWAMGDDVVGFLAYCDMVCPAPFEDEKIEDYRHEATKFIAIKEWYNTLEEFIKNKTVIVSITGGLEHKINIKKYRVANTPAEAIGFYFEAEDVTERINNKEKMCDGQKIWGWAGWLLTAGFHSGFCIAFDNIEGWGAPVFEQFSSKQEESWLPFCCNFTSSKENKFSFETAFNDVFTRIITGAYINKEDAKINDSLYAARALPLYLRQQVFPKLSGGEYRIEPFQQKDSFNPAGWCGEYFALKTNPEDGGEGKPIGIYWVGTYFDDKTRKDVNGKVISCGAIVCEKIGGEIVALKVKDGVTDKVTGLVGQINEFITSSDQQSSSSQIVKSTNG